MTEKKPGLLKRIFSFGFGKKKSAEPAPEEQAVLPAPETIEIVEAEQETARLQAEALAAEEEAKRQADKIREDELAAEAAAKAAEIKASEKAAKLAAAAEKKREEEVAAARKKAEAEELTRLMEQKLAEAKSASEREKAEEALRREAEETARKQAEAAEAVEATRKAEEQKREEEQERLRHEEESRLAAEAEAEKQAEAAARAKAEKFAQEKAVAEKEAEEQEAAVSNVEEDVDIDEMDFDEASKVPTPAEELKIEESVVTLTARKAKKEADVAPEPEEERRSGWLARLTKGLSRSSNQLKENITQVFTDKKLDDDTLQELEDILIQADLGIETAMKITDSLQDQKFGKTVTDEEVRQVMATEIEKILEPVAVDLDLDLDHQPHVILVVGVNGSGKTTTIGKLASKLYDAGFSTTLVAGDTFRAAAIEQLKIWGERTQSPVLYRPLGADSAGLAYDAWAEAKEQRRDVMLMDTAGRLQNRKELMDELEKIVRVLKKQDPSAPHTVLLTLDATTGQNALNQVEIFKEVAGVNGLVMTKLDGTARGGILVSISAKYKLPVYFVGVGEQVEDLEPFEAREFARSIAGLPREED
jgi:fused signal recognition particle receptor